MYGTTLVVLALAVSCASAQMGMALPGYFNVPATAFNRGGRVNFQGLSLGQVCKQIMMMGGKEALSDGMGAAAKWFSTQKINGQVAGGTDPQMQCLYQQATGSMMPGMVGTRDPGNMFGDYFDTVIEYPMIMDPCSNPQCNGKVNPTVLLMQAYAPMMRMGMNPFGGMGGGMGNPMGGGMGNPMGGGMGNPMAGGTMGMNPLQNNLLSALMPKPQTGMPGVPTPNAPQAMPAPAAAPAPATPQLPQGNNMLALMQNPQFMQMLQQQLMKQMLGGGAAAATPAHNPMAALMGGGGFNPLAMMFS